MIDMVSLRTSEGAADQLTTSSHVRQIHDIDVTSVIEFVVPGYCFFAGVFLADALHVAQFSEPGPELDSSTLIVKQVC